MDFFNRLSPITGVRANKRVKCNTICNSKAEYNALKRISAHFAEQGRLSAEYAGDSGMRA